MTVRDGSQKKKNKNKLTTPWGKGSQWRASVRRAFVLVSVWMRAWQKMYRLWLIITSPLITLLTPSLFLPIPLSLLLSCFLSFVFTSYTLTRLHPLTITYAAGLSNCTRLALLSLILVCGLCTFFIIITDVPHQQEFIFLLWPLLPFFFLPWHFFFFFLSHTYPPPLRLFIFLA
jgi:hypothetical protein